tara:strand:- start:14 stop:463 length:450 start_codon:yes stop_codon:yes gene_type:complete
MSMTQETRAQVDHIMDQANRQIWVTLQHEGIHCYPAASTDPKLNTSDEYDVSFLASPHRHIFHFRVAIDVFHNDREIEFIQFKRWLNNLYSDSILELNNKSCEMIADDLYLQIADRYPNRKVIIEVSEDGENGCTITYGLNKPSQIIPV